MPSNEPEFLELLKSLLAEDVRFVIVGGMAMVLHGSSSVTYDLDLALWLDDANVARAVIALEPFHPRPHNLSAGVPFVWDERSFRGPVVEMTTAAGDLDLLRVLPEVDSFDGLWERAEVRNIGELQVRVASLEDLVSMKKAAGRPKDLEHLRQLGALLKLRNDKDERA